VGAAVLEQIAEDGIAFDGDSFFRSRYMDDVMLEHGWVRCAGGVLRFCCV
jgi:hypothetical protein